MSINKSEITDAMRRCMHREPALRHPGSAEERSKRNWPEGNEYSGTCHTCNSTFHGPKYRIQGRVCFQCESKESTNVAILAPKTPVERVETPEPTKDSGQEYIDKWLPCIPPTRTAQQKGAYIRPGKNGGKGHIQFFTKNAVKKAANELKAILSPIQPEKPLKGPLSLMVTMVFPWPKGTAKYKRVSEGEPHASRPDCSNLIKLLEDTMTEMGFWEDDSQIYDLRVRKFRGNEPGISIRISP